MTDLADVPTPLKLLFGRLGAGFDALEAATEAPIALDLFFEEVDFEGEQARICVTVNDLVSTYWEDGAYTVVATAEGGGELCPWFRRDTVERAADQMIAVLVDAAFLDDDDRRIIDASLDDEAQEG